MIGASLLAKGAAMVAAPGVKAAWSVAKWLVPLLVILGLVIALRFADKDRDQLRKWQGVVVSAVAAEVPPAMRSTVTSSTAVETIHWIGRERRTHVAALETQSAQLRRAAAQATAAQNEAAIERKRAKERNSEREGVRGRLLDPKRSSGLTAAEWGKL